MIYCFGSVNLEENASLMKILVQEKCVLVVISITNYKAKNYYSHIFFYM